ncbi:hypothetical protein [Haloferax sp. Q22]|uniref:hypothetical protein n=1 Tax=Haloferax sp. (strain Q22) TaxID=1526048 RepID=UPI000737C817|nr:hypothetical protein [Haloferax sp. Q22]
MPDSLDYIVQDPVDYDLYDSSSWNDIDGFLEQSIRNEKERLEQQLEQIYRQLDERKQIHEEKIESIEAEIRRQKDRLDSADRAPGNDDVQIRNRLQVLYQEKWEAKESVWQDKQDLLEEKRDVVQEIRELDESRDLEELL